MPSRSTAVSRKPKKPYHHGDLRRALLDAALAMLNEPGGASLLTLREVARRAGVSHAAPYRHFPSKESLLSEVAEEGFRQMCEEMLKRAARVEGDPLAQLIEVGVAYVVFATGHPAHFRVMFGAELSYEAPGLREAASATFQTLLDSIQRCQAAGVMRAGEPRELAAANWSMVHGLSQLTIDGRLAHPTGVGVESIESLTRTVCLLLQHGAIARPPGA